MLVGRADEIVAFNEQLELILHHDEGYTFLLYLAPLESFKVVVNTSFFRLADAPLNDK